MLEYKTNRAILEELNKHVKGHETFKKALINLANRSTLRYFQKWKHLTDESDLVAPGRCLGIGDSGTGKTHTVRVLFNHLLDKPVMFFDASKLRPGDGGAKDVGSIKWMKSQMLEHAKELVIARPYRYHSVEGTLDQMVCVIDEIDKLSYSYESSGNWNNHIQASLLELLDQRTDEYSGVSYVLLGAFTKLERKHTVKPTKSIGFHHHHNINQDIDPVDERLIAGGMLPELIGRLTSIIELDHLAEKDYHGILEEILLPKKLEELMHFNHVNVKIEQKLKDEIVKKAIESKQGVRYIKRRLDEWSADLEFYYEEVTEEDLLLNCLENRYKRQGE